MNKKKTDKEKLRLWQERLGKNDAAYSAEVGQMDEREDLYLGTDKLKALVTGGKKKKTPHVRNVCAETIEAQVSSAIPQPKVTAKRPRDEGKAKLIEDMLRCELDRMSFEEINDMMERTVPIQGGAAFLLEWDNSQRTQCTVGELSISAVHPKQIVPQDGVYTGIEDMDYIILKVPQTKEYIKRRYGVDVTRESEEEPEARGGDGTAEDLVTQYVAYYRNKKGGIGLYSWVGDVQLEDLEDYQARRLRRCKKCGTVEPTDAVPAEVPTMDGTRPDINAKFRMQNAEFGMQNAELWGPRKARRLFGEKEAQRNGLKVTNSNLIASGAWADAQNAELILPQGGTPGERNDTQVVPYMGGREGTGGYTSSAADGGTFPSKGKASNRKTCPYCGADAWEEAEEDFEEVWIPIQRMGMPPIPGVVREAVVSETEVDEMGLPRVETIERPTLIPYYKPDIFPVILQKNVSVHGRFLGDSDIDKIKTQQNTINHIEAKIIDKLVKSGSYMTLPDAASIRADDEDMKIIRPGSAADAALIGVHTMEGDISQDMAYLEQVYQEARQIIGITDSFQGRTDTTATSGKAKEFAAAQSAGRLESKRVMKNAAYATLFEAMFKFRLAYTDEPRPVLSKNIHGETEYNIFNRYDFLEQDEAGQWYWNDQFLFSCDTTAPLAANREAMWQETRMNLQTGAFGDPTSLETLISFWEKMEALHYPTAGETKKELQERLQRQIQMQQQQMMMQQVQAQQALQMQNAEGGMQNAGIENELPSA